jgi:hypothetical protein
MSVDYHVAVHAANWPTVQMLQQCIDQREWPIKLGTKNNPLWTKPFASVPQTLGLPVTFNQEPIELEASFVTLSPTDSFGYQLDRQPDIGTNDASLYHLHPNEALKPLDINKTLLRIGASGVNFSHGDRVLSLSFRSNFKEYQAGAYIMAALIICFDGYGFELQGGQHGASEYADMLVRDASEETEK